MFRKGFLTKAAAWLTVLVLVIGMIPSQVFAGSPVLTVRCSVPEAGLSYTASSGTYQDLVPDENGTLSVELTDGLVDIAITDLKGSGEGYVFKGWKIYVSDVQYGPVTEADSASLKEALSSAVVFADGTDVFVSADGSLGFYGTVQSGITFEAVFESQEVTSPQENDPVIDETQESSGPMRGDPEAWDGETVSEPSVIDGVYQIGTAAELAWFASKVNDGTGVNYDAVLTKDIDLNNKQWTPIGKGATCTYTGAFSGNKHVIDSLFIDNTCSTNYFGLFGYVNGAIIEDLTIKGSIVLSDIPYSVSVLNVGGFVGASGANSTKIINCTNNVHITITGCQTNGHVYVGGIIGSNGQNSIVLACTNYGNISGESAFKNSKNMCVGGISGSAPKNAIIEGCRNFGIVRSADSKVFGKAYAGGIVSRTANGASINGCYSIGEVTASAQGGINVGAICGFNANDGHITNCFYLAGSCASGVGNLQDSDGIVQYKTDENIKSADFVATMNSVPAVSDYVCQWEPDSTGYPSVVRFSKNSGIKSFTVDGQNAVIDRETMIIALTIPFDSAVELTSISPVVVCFGGGDSTPASGVEQDFTNPLTYTASDGTAYTVIITKEPFPFEGTGTEDEPYLIPDAASLLKLSELYNAKPANWAGKYWKQTADIDLGGSQLIPISSRNTAFSGVYDGGSYRIKNMIINTNADYAGLFGYIGDDAILRNIIIDGSCSISGSGAVTGSIVGWMMDNTTVENCINYATVQSTNSGGSVGGIVGSTGYYCRIVSCSNYGDISIIKAGTGKAGGITSSAARSEVIDCHNYGNVTALSTPPWAGMEGGSFAGGIAAGGFYFVGCSNNGRVSAGYKCGGIVAEHSQGYIESCYNTGTVVRLDNPNPVFYGGGIAGSEARGTIANCYDAGSFEIAAGAEQLYTGCIAGQISTVSVIYDNCFIGDEVALATTVSGIQISEEMFRPVSSAEMKSQDMLEALNNYDEPVSLIHVVFGSDIKGENKGYPVITGKEDVLSHYAEIKSFDVSIGGKTYTGVIDGTDITIVLPYGTTKVNPTVTISDKATASPASLEEVDLSKGSVKYTVTAENGKKVDYTVSATIADSPNGLVAMYVYYANTDVLSAEEFNQDQHTYKTDVYASDCIYFGSAGVYFKLIAAEQGSVINASLNDKASTVLTSVSNISEYGPQSGSLAFWNSNNVNNQNAVLGNNTITVTVMPPDSGAGQVTVYTININLIPTLDSLAVSGDGKSLDFDKDFNGNVTSYSIDVPDNVTEIDLSAVATIPELSAVTMPEGCTEGKLDITGLDSFTVRVGNDDVYTDYTVEIHRLKNYRAIISASPADANVVITDPSGQTVHRQDDGSYILTTNYRYTYTVSAEGYVGKSGEILQTEAQDYSLDVVLEKSSATELNDVGAAWKDFRNSDYNLGITNAPTPTSAEAADLIWFSKMGENYSNAASVQIIVDDSLIVMSGNYIYKVDLATGQTLAGAQMAGTPDWGYTPPTYARGMIFCPLGKGTIQAFNAETLESLWIYQDPLKGQSISPIAYADGYIYTGFWNGEVNDANYVCISITDEDPTKTDEAKPASWSYTYNGGFYWAGAVALGDYVIVGTDDGTRGYAGDSKLLCFDRRTGEVVSSIVLAGMGDQRSSIAYDKASGRVFFTTKNGYLCSAAVDTETGTLSGLVSHSFAGSQSTSTPVVYKGKVYVGMGAGIGAAGQFVCSDAESLDTVFTVDLLGYPQCSMLLSTAYEDEGYLFFYSTYNALPGGVTMIKVDTDGTSGAAEEIYDAADASEYCICSIICDDEGTLYYKNDTGYVFSIGVADSSKVERLIDAIGEVTLDSGDAIASARNAYNALDDEAKSKVGNYQKLVEAEDTLASLRAAQVKDLIDALPAVSDLTLDDEDAVKAALNAYNALPADAKAKVSSGTKNKLDDALAKMSELRAEKVSDMIAALPEAKDVKLSDESRITAARRAYSELSDAEKEMVTNLNRLIGAETALKKLKDQQPEGSTKAVTVTINGVTYEVSEATKAAVEAIQKILEPEDPSKALPENFSDLSDEQEKQILDAYRLYNALTHDEKLFVNNFSGFEDILEKLGEKYHTDEATGVSVAGSNADLPWNIKAVIRPVKIDDSILEKIREVLGEDAEMSSLYEVSFVDVLTGQPYEPDILMDIILPAPKTADGMMPVVIKLSDNGDILFAEADITDEGIVYTSSEGGSMGIAATSKSWDEILPSENTAEKEGVSPIWFILAGIGVIGIIILLLWKRRRDEEEE